MRAVAEPQMRPQPQEGSLSASAVRGLEIALATSAVASCGVLFRLLGASAFSKKIGQPLLDVLSKVGAQTHPFMYSSQATLPKRQLLLLLWAV